MYKAAAVARSGTEATLNSNAIASTMTCTITEELMNNDVAVKPVDFAKAEMSLYDGVRPQPVGTITLEGLMQRTRKPDAELDRMVRRVRDAVAKHGRDSQIVKTLKKQLPSVSIGGTFRSRNGQSLVRHSGLMAVDLDEVGSDEVMDTISGRLMGGGEFGEHRVVACFRSPTNTGLKVLVAVQGVTTAEQHRTVYDAVALWMKAEHHVHASLDRSGSDVSRLCYLSADPSAWVAQWPVVPFVFTEAVHGVDGDGAGDAVADGDDGLAVLARADLRVGGVTLDDARKALTWLDPGCEYGDWMRVGMALHAQFGGTAQDAEALDLWDIWSSGGLGLDGEPAKYQGRREIESKWLSLARSRIGDGGAGAAVTWRSLVRMAKEAGMPVSRIGVGKGGGRADIADASPEEVAAELMAEKSKNIVRQYQDRMKAAVTVQELMEIGKQIGGVDMLPHDRDTLTETLRVRWVAVADRKIAKADAEAMTGFRAADWFAKDGCPVWAEGWVFVNSDGAGSWHHMAGGRVVDPAGFDREYLHECITPMQRAAGQITPSVLPTQLLVGANVVQKVAGVRYQPGKDAVFDYRGFQYVNSWRPDSQPEAVDELMWSDEDRAAVELWRGHLRWLVGDEAAGLLEKFLGWLVQHPDQRIRWSYLIQGPEGNGKSIIGECLMAAVLGQENVSKISNSTLSHPTFNEWADGRQLSVIEELFVDGHNQMSVVNSMKSPLADDNLQIHPKGGRPYQIQNVTSYLVFTNKHNALPLNESSRRYYIAECRVQSVDFIRQLGGDRAAEAYFQALVAAAEGHAGALRGWLAAVPCADLPRRAPDSEGKRTMVAASRSDIEQVVIELIESGQYPGVNRLAVSSSALRIAVQMSEHQVGLGGPRHINSVMRSLGYYPVSTNMIAVKYSSEGEMTRATWYINRDKMSKEMPKWNKMTPVEIITKAIEIVVGEK